MAGYETYNIDNIYIYIFQETRLHACDHRLDNQSTPDPSGRIGRENRCQNRQDTGTRGAKRCARWVLSYAGNPAAVSCNQRSVAASVYEAAEAMLCAETQTKNPPKCGVHTGFNYN